MLARREGKRIAYPQLRGQIEPKSPRCSQRWGMKNHRMLLLLTELMRRGGFRKGGRRVGDWRLRLLSTSSLRQTGHDRSLAQDVYSLQVRILNAVLSCAIN
jgi:hypothetical protein